MNAEERLARSEGIEMACWLTPLPDLDSKLLFKVLTEVEPIRDSMVITGNAFETDESILPDLGPLSSLGKWEAVAATMDKKVQLLSGFEPTVTDFDEIIWQNYAYKFSTMPFLLSKTTQRREISISSLSLSEIIDAIEDMILAVATENTFNAIIDSIKKMFQVAIESEGSEEKTFYTQQGIISGKSSLLYVGYLRATVEMTYKSGEAYESLTQKIIIDNFSGSLDFEKCKRDSRTLLSWDGSDINEWMQNTSSANSLPNNSPAWKTSV